MVRLFRISPSRLALGYIALSVLALALFAIPLWFAWKANVATFKAYVDNAGLEPAAAAFDSQGAQGLAAAIDSQARPAGYEVVVLADGSKRRGPRQPARRAHPGPTR